MPGRLIVCPTPIGNLEDLSDRQRRALAEADVVACEDTRRTGLLYERLDLDRPRLVSNHEGNEADRARQLAQAIERGAKVVLISDAGHARDLRPRLPPDPGVHRARARDRGAARALRGHDRAGGLRPAHRPVAVRGLPAAPVRELERVLGGGETVVAFESPRRLPDSLAALAALAPDRPAAVCRELTKMHEDITRGSLAELARRFRSEVKGEIVVVIGPAAGRTASAPDIAFAVDALRRLVQSGARPRAAASVVAALTGTRANDLYTALTGREPRE